MKANKIKSFNSDTASIESTDREGETGSIIQYRVKIRMQK